MVLRTKKNPPDGRLGNKLRTKKKAQTRKRVGLGATTYEKLCCYAGVKKPAQWPVMEIQGANRLNSLAKSPDVFSVPGLTGSFNQLYSGIIVAVPWLSSKQNHTASVNYFTVGSL